MAAVNLEEVGVPTPTETPAVTPTAPIVPAICAGNCDADSAVVVNELIICVNIALEQMQPAACPHGIPDGMTVDIAFLIRPCSTRWAAARSRDARGALQIRAMTVGPASRRPHGGAPTAAFAATIGSIPRAENRRRHAVALSNDQPWHT
jgi:hypothetical protein